MREIILESYHMGKSKNDCDKVTKEPHTSSVSYGVWPG